MIIPERLYSTEEVSEYLHLSLRTVQRLLKNQALNAYKIHGQYRIKGLDLLSYLEAQRNANAPQERTPAQLVHLLNTQALSIEFGANWLSWVEPTPEHDTSFLQKLSELRTHIVKTLGFIFPGIQVRDNLQLTENGYRVLLHGVPIFTDEGLPGEVGLNTLFLHLEDLLRRYAHEVLSRDEVALILEHLEGERPAVIQEVMVSEKNPTGLSAGQLTQILRYLLKEGVSIRQQGFILESLADQLSQTDTRQIEMLAEGLRQRLRRQINAPLVVDGLIEVMAFEPAFENALCEQFLDADGSARFASIEQIRKGLREHSECRVLLCDPKIRRQLHHYLHRQFPDVQVLAYQEIAEDYRVKQVHLFQQESA